MCVQLARRVTNLHQLFQIWCIYSCERRSSVEIAGEMEGAMWNELQAVEDKAVRSTAGYDVVPRHRDQDLEHQLCQATSGRPWFRPVSWLSRWLAGYRAAKQCRLAKQEESKWTHRSMVL